MALLTAPRSAAPWAGPIRAVLWAQFRILRNFYPRSNRLATAFATLLTVFWYALWTALAVFVAGVLRHPPPHLDLPNMLSNGLLLVFAYWQLVPLILVSSGMSLDLRRLAVYPFSNAQLFWMEVFLRITVSIEMLIVLLGAAVGLISNPQRPDWGPLALLPFVLFNLLVGVAVKDLLTRLLAQRGWRELVVLLFVSLAALPQYIGAFGLPAWVGSLIKMAPPVWLPWSATAGLLLGQPTPSVGPFVIVGGWSLAAYLFARWQFARSLRFDRDETKAAEQAGARSGLIEYFYCLPRHLFNDPLAALLEKELRFLSRAPRFRLVFLMGFSFGLMIWLPMAMGRLGPASRTGFLNDNFLTVVCIYALTLLAEVAFWNHLGFDRAAAQLYFLAPISYRSVIVAKNLAGFAFLLLELAAVFLVMTGLRLPLHPSQFLEAVAVTLVLGLFLASVGNAGSTLYPRPVDPSQSWRSSSAGRFHTLLLVFYPLASAPILLAYTARHLLESTLAFYGVLFLGAGAGFAIYRVVLEFAATRAVRDREKIIATLSATAGPVAS